MSTYKDIRTFTFSDIEKVYDKLLMVELQKLSLENHISDLKLQIQKLTRSSNEEIDELVN